MSKKVLYLGGFELPDKNAAAQRVLAVAKSMKMAGYKIEFIGVSKNESENFNDEEYNGFTYTSVCYPRSIKSWLYHISHFLPLEEISRREPDYVILYNFPAIAQRRIIKFCHNNKIKVIADITEWYVDKGLTIRDIIKRWDVKQRMKKENFHVDGIIAISRFLENYYKDKVNTIYIPATVDLNEVKWQREKQLKISSPIRLVYAGSPGGMQKDRIDEVVNSTRGRNGFVLNVYGINEKQFVDIYDKTYTNSDNIIFHGHLPHLEVIKMICESDFEVIIRDDNLVTRAGFPTKFVEAFSCGISVIATPTSNICEYLKDRETGFVINERDTLNDILDAILKLREDQLIRIKKNAKEVIDFDYRNYTEKIKCLLK